MLFSPGLYLPMGKKPAGVAAVPTTWNPADIGASFSLSNGNLTAAAIQPPFTGAFGGRSIANHSVGKYYWEIHLDVFTAGGFEIGIARSGWDEASALLNTANGAVIRDDGVFVYNSSNATAGFSFAAGDVINIALDLGNSKIWFRKNGAGNWNGSGTDDPATNAGGLSIAGFSTPAYAAAFLNGANNITVTARFSSVSWTGTAPSGFGQL